MINFSLIPPPNIIEPLNFDTIYAAMLADLVALDPAYNNIAESDPAVKILQVAAYREVLVRQRINDAARGVMLSSATGADLDQLAALYGVARLEISPADPLAVPPTLAVMESDDAFRQRILLAIYSRSTAGPVNQYRYLALSANADVLDVSVNSPIPGEVVLSVLSRTGDGTPLQAVLDDVLLACDADNVRPLTDVVSVVSANIVHYSITAAIYVYAGPYSAVVLANAQAGALAYSEAMKRLGYDINISALYSAIHVEGVQRVELAAPLATMVLDNTQSSFADAITITLAGTAQ